MEDEAVVTEAFRKAGEGALELLDIHQLYPGIKGRRGLKDWKVCITKEEKHNPGLQNKSP